MNSLLRAMLGMATLVVGIPSFVLPILQLPFSARSNHYHRRGAGAVAYVLVGDGAPRGVHRHLNTRGARAFTSVGAHIPKDRHSAISLDVQDGSCGTLYVGRACA